MKIVMLSDRATVMKWESYVNFVCHGPYRWQINPDKVEKIV